MKQILAGLVCGSLALGAASPALAGGWGAPGAVVAGAVAGGIVYNALQARGPVVVCGPVAPSVVYAAPGAVYYPYARPLVVSVPPPVVVAPVVVYRHAGWGRYRRAW